MKTVRILPMNHENETFVGKTIEEVQKGFFCKTLIENKGWYYYGVSGLKAEAGDLVLFQMDNQIIASALYKEQLPVYGDKDSNGAILFYCYSIKIFKPIFGDELVNYIKEFKRFGDTKYLFTLDEDDYQKLLDRLSIGL